MARWWQQTLSERLGEKWLPTIACEPLPLFEVLA